jgi:cobyrinic acid a,c-diamide synthase
MVRGVMIAGTASGVGKTTTTIGLIGALRRRGLTVQPFKAGPDYIDPTYHGYVAAMPSRNLDTWLLAPASVDELFTRAARHADFAVVEGVMGLYNGRSARSEEGSSAELANRLGLPVLLVVDTSAAARNVAAAVLGFQQFDPQVLLAGVIFNGIGSEQDARLCQEAIELSSGILVLGALPRRDDLGLSERHLGLVPVVEGAVADAGFERITNMIAALIDVDRLLPLARLDTPPVTQTLLFPTDPIPNQVRIAVAMDRAFSFYYQDSLDLFASWGAELAPFSPLEDTSLPVGTAGIYIGGGFLELYARDLAANAGMIRSLWQAAQLGISIYAECGGLMYLGQSIIDFQGEIQLMAGLFPARSRLGGSRLTLGYQTVRALANGALFRKGQEVRGHEFHWLGLEDEFGAEEAYEIPKQGGRREGFQHGNTLASYVHLHLPSDRGLAPGFVTACWGTQQERLQWTS